ncbi:MAG: YncE family protein [Frankiales bacterium]|nr:YncE family protein [Frankiales bacterium]
MAYGPRAVVRFVAVGALLAVTAACSSSSDGAATPAPVVPSPSSAPPSATAPAVPSPTPTPAPVAGTIPAGLDPLDLYAAGRPGGLSAEAAQAKSLIYVPDDDDATVHVIDPATYQVLRVEKVGNLPQHVTPSWDLKTLWVDNDQGNSLTPIDPRTGTFGTPVPVDDPYNLYFTADGLHAVVVAERLGQLDFRDPHTMALQHSLEVPCKGVDHADFSADGTHALFSCEFSGEMVWVDMVNERVERTIDLPRQHGVRPKPQDVKTSPDGALFYVADEDSNGVFLIDARTLEVLSFLPTAAGAHGLYVSRDSKDLYVSNRKGHSVSVISFATRGIRATWPIPNGSPDMGGVSADGKVLWLSGRYNREVYAINTADGSLLARIPVGGSPHGLCVWPQPGRYSLGHTGLLR